VGVFLCVLEAAAASSESMLRVLLCVGVLVWAVPSSPCDNDLVRHKRFCDSSLTLEQRARALVSELTLEEKVLQTLNEAPAIPRLAIPAYQWWTESLHGILSQCTADGRCPTSFPMPIGLAASFNMTLVRDVAQAVSSEARRLFMDEAIRGLDFWAVIVSCSFWD
jgi:beta-glucosidase-like glycosyl hydrolase